MGKDAHDEASDIANSNIRKPSARTSIVTELEGVILGIVWGRQPCSPYVVLSRFQQSPTWGWSSSTGAIYPAIRRLKARGLLNHRAESTGKRRSEALSLSAKGTAALQEWIANLNEEMGSGGLDPIRTRVNYLAALAPEARLAFLDRAEEVTRSRLQLARESQADPHAKDNWTLQATRSGLAHQLEARLRWLGELRDLVEREGSAARRPA
jgi:DNA-binding PadR family transcriptional regulator